MNIGKIKYVSALIHLHIFMYRVHCSASCPADVQMDRNSNA